MDLMFKFFERIINEIVKKIFFCLFAIFFKSFFSMPSPTKCIFIFLNFNKLFKKNLGSLSKVNLPI